MKKNIILSLVIFLINSTGLFAQESSTKIPIIIDADTANEVDDLFALVRAIHEPKFNILGITSAQFHTSPLATDTTVLESQAINEKLIELLKVDIPLPVGSNSPIKDRVVPAKSAAASFIIKKAHEMQNGQKLQLVILGSCTNVASAILIDPTIIPKIQVQYLGFWHNTETNDYNKKEFNSGNDPLAVEILLDTPNLDLSVMTATTSQKLVFDKVEVETKLKNKGPVADYLINRWNTYTRWWTKEDPEKAHWVMWDVAIIEAIANPALVKTQQFSTPIENVQRPINIYTYIDVPKATANFYSGFAGNHQN